MISLLVKDGFYGSHILKPIKEGDPDAFYTMWDYDRLQNKWAEENNIKHQSLEDILKAQFRSFNPEVIYNMSPQKLNFSIFEGLSFGPKLLCWNADPHSISLDRYDQYDALLTSSIEQIKADSNPNAVLFYPSKDELMDNYRGVEKKIDVFFYGQYTNDVFKERKEYIDKLIPFLKKYSISFKFCIMYTSWEEPMINRRYLWKVPFLQKSFPSKKTIKNFSEPIFGLDVYKNIAESKIIFNISGGLEVFGNYKFNMRIFETLGTGSFMLSDKGSYPENIVDGEDFVSYTSFEDLSNKIKYYLDNKEEREAIALSGTETINEYYSKDIQWQKFKSIVNKL